MKPYIIAEIGSNCFKSEDEAINLEAAKRQCRKAREHGADAAKFQMYTAAEIYGPRVVGSDFEKSFNKFAMPEHWLEELSSECIASGIEFMCSGFSVLGFLKIEPFVQRHKLASPEVCSDDLCDYLFSQSKPVIFSLGCTLNYADIIKIQRRARKRDVALECASNYPAEIQDYDLGFAKDNFGKWGVSDHTKTNHLALYARARGARYFEKHVDFLPWGSETPDTKVSIGPDEFASYAKAIRAVDANDKVRTNSKRSYGRVKSRHGEFRPLPI